MDRSALTERVPSGRPVSAADAEVWITISDVRRRFHRILREVERGTTFVIVRRGVPVARLVPFVRRQRLAAASETASASPPER